MFSQDFMKAVAIRFVKAFVAGGLAQLGAQLTITPAGFGSLAETKTWAAALAAAFLTGGLMAVNKLMRFDPTR